MLFPGEYMAYVPFDVVMRYNIGEDGKEDILVFVLLILGYSVFEKKNQFYEIFNTTQI